jgi:hypothetical protein
VKPRLLAWSRLRAPLNVARLFAVCGLAGCVGHEDGTRLLGRVTHVRDREAAMSELAPSIHRLPPMEVERAPATPALAQIAGGPAFAATSARTDAALLALLETAAITPGGRSITGAPTTIEVQIEGGRFTHFVAETGRDWSSWSNLLAGSRLGVALGVGAAPETVLRTFDRKTLKGLMRPRDQRRGLPLWDDQKRAGPIVRGAMFAVPTPEQRVRFDRRAAWSFWSEALRQDAPAASTRRLDRDLWARNELLRGLAPQLSSAIVLDHLLGMRDRWGSDPVVIEPKAPRLVSLDLDGALDPRAALDAKRKPGQALPRVERFSRGVIAALRALGREQLIQAVGRDEQGARLLDETQLGFVLARRDEILKHVDGLIARYGESLVLCWD